MTRPGSSIGIAKGAMALKPSAFSIFSTARTQGIGLMDANDLAVLAIAAILAGLVVFSIFGMSSKK